MRYAISDIHGCLKSFQALLKKIKFSKKDELFLLGDYIDRGPDSKGVIDYIWHLQAEGYKLQCLKGNHEQMMLDARQDMSKQRMWLMNGGMTTSESFNAAKLSDIPKRYFHWMEELPHYLEVDQYILVHAGLNFDVGNPLDHKHSMLWIRKWYEQINYDWLGDRIIIHGHTPTMKTIIQKRAKDLDFRPALVIDNGCVFKNDGLGSLIAYNLDKQSLHFQVRVEEDY